MKIAVLGLGYVGSVTGACLAEVGNHVLCVDIDEAMTNLCRCGTYARVRKAIVGGLGISVLSSHAMGAEAGWVQRLKAHLPKALYELLELAYSFHAYRRLLRAAREFRPDFLYERYNLVDQGISAEMIAERWGFSRGQLDEIAAHLDRERLAALFDLLSDMGAQAWMTGVERDPFAALAPALAHFFNHQAHHRGQAHTILCSFGRRDLVLDLLFFQREAGRA